MSLCLLDPSMLADSISNWRGFFVCLEVEYTMREPSGDTLGKRSSSFSPFCSNRG